MRQNLPVTGRNLELPKDANILSTTSPQSHITYVNPDFIKISGFTEEELLGQPHNIVRHPDMPPAAFEHMWSTLKSGRSWMGLVKNRCKNGDHYWVSAYVTPIAKNGSIVEYQSVRTKPEPEQVLAAEKLYAQLRSGKAARPKLAASFSVKILLLIWGSIISSAMAAGMLTDTSISSLLLATLMSGSLSSVSVLAILSPLGRLVERARNISNNPLSQSLYTGRTDEFGQIEFALRMMQAETGAIVGRIGDASNRLSEHTRGLLKDIESSNVLTVEQQAETDQIATAVNQMVASIQEVASNAQHAADAAGRADTETASGQRLPLKVKLGKPLRLFMSLKVKVTRYQKFLTLYEGSPSKRICWHSTQQLRPRVLVSRGVVLLLSPMRFAVLLLAHSNRQRIFKA